MANNSLNINNHLLIVRCIIMLIAWGVFSIIFPTLISGQNGSQLEYFINTDPGIGNGTTIPIPNNDTVDINFYLNLQNLQDGLHSLYIRAKKSTGVWSFTQKYTFLKIGSLSHEITQLEYFVDTDPGFGSAIQVPFNHGDSVNVNFMVNLDNLSPGVHTLYVRGKKANGLWSFTQANPFLVYNLTSNPNITVLEYYYDIDPGYGNAIPISFMPNDTVDVTQTLTLSGLTVGNHKLLIRGKDINGQWSYIFRRDVNVTATDNLYPAITITPALKTLNAENCITAVVDSFTVTNTGSNMLNVNNSESASWMSISPVAMGIPAGESRTLYVTATPSPTLPAQSSANITFTTNDPVNPTVTIPVVFNVPISTYTMTVSSDTLIIGPVQVNRHDSTTLTLTNLSCGNLVIDSITHSNTRFSNTLPNTSGVTSLPGYTFLGTYNGHTYFKSNGTSTWPSAVASISTLMNQLGLNGYMVSLNNSYENEWLLPLTNESDVFIGLNDADGSGNIYPCEANSSSNPQLYCWQWQDGTSILSNNYSNWYPGEPNNCCAGEDWGHMGGSTNSTVAFRGKWNDAGGSTSLKHILEVASGFPSGTTNDITIKFESPDVGTFTDTMVIHSSAGLDTVIVLAEALGVPVMALAQDSLEIDFDGCAVDTLITNKIYNTGNGPLVWSVNNNNLPSWLSVVADSNEVAANDSLEIQIQIINATLTPGTHPFNIVIQSNDTLQLLDTIYLLLDIAGDSSLTMQYLSVVFDTIARNTSVTLTSQLINNGCTPVYVSDVSFGTAAFDEHVSTIYLPPYSSYPMLLKFQPPLAGNFYDTLVVQANTVQGLHSFPVFGHATGALTYQLSKLLSSVTIQDCDGMTMDTIYLKNIGDGGGTWSIGNTTTIPSWLMINPMSGSLPAGDSIAIAFGYDGTGLINNNYNYQLRLNMSDPQTPYVNIPASMYVVGGAVTGLSKDTLNYGLTYFTTTKLDSVTIFNTGCDTFFVSNVLAESQFTVNPANFAVLPDSSKTIYITYTPSVTGIHSDTLSFISATDTLYLEVYGQSVQYPTIPKATRDSITITMPAPIDAGTLNTNTMVVWGEQSGKRTGSYSVRGNDIHFLPTQPFFAGEEVTYTLTQNVQYSTGQNVQPFSDSRNVKVWNPTQGEFVIRPTDKVFSNIPGEFHLNDLNADGKIDFLFKTSSTSVGVMLRQNDNSLSNLINTNHSSDINTLEQIKDFNGDGFNDLVYSSGGVVTGKLNILLNNGSGQFTNGPSVGTGYGARSLILDLDNDGLFDVVGFPRALLGLFGPKIETFRNLNNSNFQLLQSSGVQNNVTAFQITDLNRNGYTDIIGIGRRPASTIEINYLNYFSNTGALLNQNFTSVDPTLSIASKYIYNLSGNFGSDPIIRQQNSLGIINNNSTSLPGFSPMSMYNQNVAVIMGDIDGDNRIDIIPIENSLKVFKNQSDNNFQTKNFGYKIGAAISQNMADLDNDGDLDFAYLDAQGKLWIAYNEDNTADMALSQYAISDTLMCGDSITVPISIRNIGTSQLVWQQDAAISSPSGGDYKGVAGATWLSSSSQYSEIPAGDSLVLNLKIKTTSLTNGSYNFNYIINSNDSENYKDTVTISFVVETDSSITINPVAWDFGLVDTAQVYTKNIVINNTSCQPVTISGAFNAGGLYTVTGLTPATIPAFSTRTLTVSLNPNTLTSYADTLVLTQGYGVQAITLAAQGCYISPVHHIYEQVCTADSVGLDSILYQNVSGCDSLVVWHYILPGINPQGLKLAMPFNGNANDVSENNFNGTVSGAILTADRFGQPNKAYSFDGNDQIITQQNNTISGNNPRTMMAWVNINEIVQNNHYSVIRAGANGSANDFTLLIQFNASNQLRLILRNYTTDLYSPYVNYSVGTWAHVAVSYSGSPSHSIKLFLNGSLLASSNVNLNTAFTNYIIGNYVDQTGGNSFYKGKIDDVLVYPYSLSEMDISQIFNLNLNIFDNSPIYGYSQSCETTQIGLDTTVLVGANMYGCDSTIITQTSLQLPVSNEGLVAYYPFSGNANDGSGLGKDGTVDGATLTTDRFGNANMAYSYDGLDDFISPPNHVLKGMPMGSFSGWVYFNNTNFGTIIDKTITGTKNYFQLLVQNENAKLRLLMDSPDASPVNFTSNQTMVINKWYHYVITWDGSKVKMYINGKLDNQVNSSADIDNNSAPIFIGKVQDNSRRINGKLDDFLVFNRSLDPSEIQSIYLSQSYINTCIPSDVGLDTLTLTNVCGQDSLVQQITSLQTPISPDKLQAYYPFTGNASDMSGWGNHGTVSGATLTTDHFGNANGAYSFDGLDDFIQINNPPKNFDKEISVSCWINVNSFQIGSGIGQSQANVNSSGTWLIHGNVDKSLIWYVNDNGTWRNTPNSPLLPNGWNHIVGTAKSDSLRLYLNGVLVAKTIGISNRIIFDPSSVVQMGKDVRYSSGRYMNGSIDDVQIFNRALTQAEITALYTNSNTNYTFNALQSCDTLDIGIDTLTFPGAAQNGCDSIAINVTSLKSSISNEGLLAYYTFDGNANDRSGYGRHGVVAGATLTQDRFGNANAAYTFDGVDDRIESLDIPINGNGDWTIAAALKFNTLPNYNQSILSNISQNFEIGVNSAQSQLNIFAGSNRISANNAIRPNQYDIFVFRKSGIQLSIYRNDTLLIQNNNGAGISLSSVQSIGTWNTASSDPNQKRPFKGIMDDLWVYQRALNANELRQLYLLNHSPDHIIAPKDTAHIFAATMTGLSDSFTTHISNTSCDTVYLNNISVTNPIFTHNLTIPYLLPYQSKEFTITFTPYASVPFAGNMIIISNGVDTVSIALSGSGCDLCACPTSDVVIQTQTQLNDFVALYGGCDTIPVNMTLAGDATLANLTGLQFIKRIEGNLHILNSQGITGMTGWQNLAGLGGELRIENNSQLVSIDSLVDLVAIGGQLSIKNNTVLPSLNGLQNLLSVSNNLTITNNATLTNCSAICNVMNAIAPAGILGTRTISGNPSECSSLNEVNIRCATACLSGNIILTTQAEVNAFVAKGNMLSCNTLMGNLTISGANIQNLAGMTFLKQITGNLTLQNNTILPNINGLDSLRKVGNTLSITGNPALIHINGLSRLDTVGLDITIQNNAALSQVNGLANVDRVGRNLNVSNNGNLTDCSGLCTLITVPVSVVGTRTVTNNPSPCSSITEVRIKCKENECPNEDYILRTQVEVNTFIASFNDCDSIIGNLTIEGGNSINNISGLSFIKYISGSLTIRNNNLLTTLSGFDNLAKVNWALRIENNAALTNMTQLKKLKHIGNELRLVNNDAMIVLTGLDSIQHIGTNLTLTQNNVLVDASQLCRLINQDVVNGNYIINNNPSPVSSVNEVTAICIYGSLVTKVLIQNTPDTIEEGTLLIFNVALDYPANDTVNVSLVSSNQAEIPLPSIVKINPGTISRQVSVLLPDNNIPEKDKPVTITASAPYLIPDTKQIILTDHNDVPPIELIITQAEVSEGAGLYATSARVKRLGALGSVLNVTLQSDNPTQVILPPGVNILANETEKSFFIGVVDNALAEGNRINTITATVIINSCVCPAPPGTNGVSSKSFTILDNDGPALTLMVNPLSMPEAKTNAGTLTITRNTATNVPMAVQLMSSDTTELVLPATATIPVNASSVNVTVTTKSDLQEDGNQEVTITASHPGYTNGVIWAIVTDINKPDLVIPSAEALEDTIALEEILPFKVYIHNKGLTTSTRGVSLIGYLSSDASISSDDHVIGQYFLDISIPAGDTIVYGGIGSIPQRIGNFNLLFKINPNESITELLYHNNTSPAVPVTIVPNYTGTAIVDSTVFLIGAPVVIYGSSYNSQGAKIGNANLDIYLIRDGIRRTIAIKTNAQGDYSYTFNPLQSDFGHFIVGACYPGFNMTDQQDAFDILGLRVNNGNFLTWDMLLGDTINSGLAVRNVTNISIPNVTMTPLSLPNGCTLVFDTISNFPANTTLSLGYQIIAGAVTTPGVYQQFPIAVKTNNTVLQQVTGYYHCKAPQGFLMASVTSIVQNININQSRLVEFTITNKGQGNTGPVSIAVPNANWVRLVSPASIPSLASNQSATISVEFIPTPALPLNTPATGNVAINATNAGGISVPFTITKVSDLTGNIFIDVINQFTYFTPEAPHLGGVNVRITNYFTGQVYAEGVTNTQGIFHATNLPEGQLRIVVSADKHKTHDGVLDISPGNNGTKVIFLEYRAISFSWDVQPTTIEDEYEIDLIMNFEANVPVPVIVMSMPDSLPRLTGSETFSFYINMTNKGLITAKEVKLDLPLDPEYELVTTYQAQDILAQQTIQVPVLMKRREGSNTGNRMQQGDGVIKEAEKRLYFIKN